ncbi:hypothetical protein SAMN04490182_4535 [Pseudomonas cedrina]|uniref:Uncharacterized protein n=2 Tax=Pseudomonas cedrina TaxID=651740 RepID=A0A1V2K5E4_PSECE|nr:hypothetical protein [Pseudomonas cedrina]ONH52829.1 hypothetical protein BLL36_18320 [Pseudomonas cedrina subsp. cedrina]SDT41483.1 hypothetical protein SAMN04490182_4535 [Pseudomonas cedrina]
MEQFTNTVTKRIGIVLLLVGLIILSIGLYDMSGRYLSLDRFSERWLDVISWNKYRVRQYPAVFYGSYLVIIGLFLSVLYDKVIGRVVQWILTGQTKRER